MKQEQTLEEKIAALELQKAQEANELYIQECIKSEMETFYPEEDIEVLRNNFLILLEENESLKNHIFILQNQISKYSMLLHANNNPQ